MKTLTTKPRGPARGAIEPKTAKLSQRVTSTSRARIIRIFRENGWKLSDLPEKFLDYHDAFQAREKEHARGGENDVHVDRAVRDLESAWRLYFQNARPPLGAQRRWIAGRLKVSENAQLVQLVHARLAALTGAAATKESGASA